MFERLRTTRPPSKELVTDASQVTQLATTQEMTRHWATEHDWSTFRSLR